MVAKRQQPQYISVDEWRKLEQTNDVKYEYIDGQIYLMAGGSLAHSRIGLNVCATLADKLRGGPCNFYNSDAAVYLSPTRYVYPDASVSCDPHDQPTTEQMQIQAPCVVVEVLSDSTEGKDRLRKANFYRACPTIQEYMLIATRYQTVEVQRRTRDEWTIHIFGPGEEIELLSIGIHFPLATLYQGTTVPEIPNDQA